MDQQSDTEEINLQEETRRNMTERLLSALHVIGYLNVPQMHLIGWFLYQKDYA